MLRGEISVLAGSGKGDCGNPSSCAQAGVIQLSTRPTITVTGSLGLCDAKIYPNPPNPGACGPFPPGGFSFGSTVRVIGTLPSGSLTFYLGTTTIDSMGNYSVKVPEGITRIAFSSPPAGFCVTGFADIPGVGDPVDAGLSHFTCGS